MTLEKLMNTLQSVDTIKFILTGCGESVHTSREVYEAIRPLVEKQIPKKPNVKELPDAFGRLYWNVCGACDEEIESDYDYCPGCGQRIDWSEIDE